MGAHDDQVAPLSGCGLENLLGRVATHDDVVDVEWKGRTMLQGLLEEATKLAGAVVKQPMRAQLHVGGVGEERVVDSEQRQPAPTVFGNRNGVAQRRSGWCREIDGTEHAEMPPHDGPPRWKAA